MQPLADERRCSSESKARILALSSLRYQNLSVISPLGLYVLITRESSLQSCEVVNAQQSFNIATFLVRFFRSRQIFFSLLHREGFLVSCNRLFCNWQKLSYYEIVFSLLRVEYSGDCLKD